jgi:hypothetical protein
MDRHLRRASREKSSANLGECRRQRSAQSPIRGFTRQRRQPAARKSRKVGRSHRCDVHR